MNKIIVIGHLGRDPEMRYTPNGQAVTSFSVASSRRYTTSAGEQREETEWFNVSAWGKLGETCNQYLTKGQQVYIEGRMSSRTYEGRDGQTRVSIDVFPQRQPHHRADQDNYQTRPDELRRQANVRKAARRRPAIQDLTDGPVRVGRENNHRRIKRGSFEIPQSPMDEPPQ